MRKCKRHLVSVISLNYRFKIVEIRKNVLWFDNEIFNFEPQQKFDKHLDRNFHIKICTSTFCIHI